MKKVFLLGAMAFALDISVFCLLFSAALSKVHWTFFTSLPRNKEIVEAAASQQNHAEKLMHNI